MEARSSFSKQMKVKKKAIEETLKVSSKRKLGQRGSGGTDELLSCMCSHHRDTGVRMCTKGGGYVYAERRGQHKIMVQIRLVKT